MKVKYFPTAVASEAVEYDALMNLRFAPNADVINERVPIDEFQVDIITSDSINVGCKAQLLADDDTLWFNGLIVYAEQEAEQTMHIQVQSELLYLDKKKKKAKMFSNTSVADAIASITSGLDVTIIIPSGVADNLTVSGYCPKQTARERLQQVLFVNGLYITSSFVEHPTVASFTNSTEEYIPDNQIYWRPVPSYEDYVTKITATAYAYTEGTPTSDDDWVKAGGKKYIVTEAETSLTNDDAPSIAPANEIDIDNIGLINQSNVDDVLSILGRYYFKRTKVDFDVINNGEYKVGHKFSVPLVLDDDSDSDVMRIVGFAEEMDFKFGRQSESRVILGACDTSPSKKLTIKYVSKESEYGMNTQLGTRTYHFPNGYHFTVTNPYIDKSKKNMAYVFRPASDTTTGTMSGNTTITVNCYFALKKNTKTGVLEVVSVDEVNRVSHGTSPDDYYVAEIE